MQIKLKDILIFIIFLFIISVAYIYYNHREKNNNIEVKIVENSTDYYDIIGIVDKFIHTSTANNEEKVLDMLDDNYKKSKNINKSNVFEYVKKFSNANNSFSGDIIYYQDINDNIKKYYVSGKVEIQTLNNNEPKEYYYIVVLIDNKNNTFAIIPDDGKIYKEVAK